MLAPMSMLKSLFRRALVIASLTAAIGGRTAVAAEASSADSGWFDPQATNAASNAAAPPAVPAAPADGSTPRDGSSLPSLAPSPLLSQQGSSGSDAQTSDPEDRNPRALNDFRPSLDPYGTWVQHPTYGTIWVPSSSVVGTSFAPYVSSGHWALDETDNWVWVSDYPFGNVVFHYGRWVWVGGTGWAWIPGYRYAPAWVSWRVPTGSYAYVGWAPMGPDYVWFNGAAFSFWYGVPTPWIFCPSAYVFYPHVHYYVVRDRVLVTHLGRNTRPYTPASAAGVGIRGRAMTMSGPPLSAARIPARAVPAQRLQARPSSLTAARFTSPPRAADSRARFGSSPRATSSPWSRPERFRAAPSAPTAPTSRDPRALSPRVVAPRSSPGSSWAPSRAPSAPRSESVWRSSPTRSAPPVRSFSPARVPSQSSGGGFRPGGSGGFRPALPRGRR